MGGTRVMSGLIDKNMEECLVKLVNGHLPDSKVYLERYQRINFYIFDQNVFNAIMKEFKFKDIGNVYDFPDVLPQPESIGTFDMMAGFDLFQRIAISKKINSVLFYSVDTYSICSTFLIDVDHLKKFLKKTKDIIRQDTGANIFRDVDFHCDGKEYIEIMDAIEDKTKPVDVLKKKVPDENLVFDEKSTINDVMNDITTFFKDETHKLYDKLELPYKRGIILFGDPGNGKSAMIRQIIRVVPSIIKVVINPNVMNVTRILQSLTKALDSKQAIIVIEDIDSLITERNRSEFLNILDGVDIRSGIYFIGTTNYPDKIDPAFMNRSGRFDRTYKIDNPAENTRKIFFESRKIGKLLAEYKVHRDINIADTDDGVVDLFVKYSDNLPMASLKELITSTSYLLASEPDMTVEEAVEKSYNSLVSIRTEHANSHNAYKKQQRLNFMPTGYNSYDEDED